MKQALLLPVFLAWCLVAISQTGRVTGQVQDAETKTPLELATVSVLTKDSSVITYQLSDKAGRFHFEKLPVKTKLLVSVTYTGYVGYTTSVLLDAKKADTLLVSLAVDSKDTRAVVVTATVPVRMNGDTLEINPAAFKTSRDAVVEELLNQVAGLTIWSDGSITVNGKKVQNLLVDGKPFLGSTDPRVATQNLPKSAIDKIQLYQEYDRSQIGRQSQPQDSLLTMNIKLKESSKKGYFGKAGAGYGTSSRYESDLSFQVYNKKSSAGIGGGINNINKGIGNLQEMFQNNTYRNYNPNLYSVGRFGTSGINRNYSIGGVYTHSFIESANSRQNNRLAVNYNTSGTDAFVEDLTLQNRTTIRNPQFIREEGVQNNRSDKHDVGVNYIKTSSYYDNLNVNGSFSTAGNRGESSRFTEVSDSLNGRQSTNRVVTTSTRRSDNESLSVSFSRADPEEPLENVSLQLNARRSHAQTDRDVTSNFVSFVNPGQNASYNRHYATGNDMVNVGANLDYLGLRRLLFGRFGLFGLTLNLTQSLNFSRTSDNSVVTDYDSSSKHFIANANLSNQNRQDLLEYTPSLTVSKNFFRWGGTYYHSIYAQVRLLDEFKTDRNQSSFAKRNLERSFQFFRYEGNMGYQYQQREKYQYGFSLNYTKNFEYPTIDQLYAIVDDINAYEIRMGNPGLQNRINHRVYVNANFTTINPKQVFTFTGSINGGFNRSLHPVADSIRNDPSGKRLLYTTNADKSSGFNMAANLNVSRQLRKSRLQLIYNGQYNTGRSPNYIDNVYNISETGNLSNQVTLQLTLRTLLVLNVGESIQQYNTKQTAAGLNAFKNRSETTKFGLVLNCPGNVTLSSTVDRITNSNLAKPTVLWNAFATCRFMKQQGELKFSAMDLLKQYQNIVNSANSYGTTTRITNGLQQFFLLTFSYYPRKFGKPEVKSQSVQEM